VALGKLVVVVGDSVVERVGFRGRAVPVTGVAPSELLGCVVGDSTTADSRPARLARRPASSRPRCVAADTPRCHRLIVGGDPRSGYRERGEGFRHDPLATGTLTSPTTK